MSVLGGGRNENKNDSVDANLNNLVYSSLTSLHFQIQLHLNKSVLFLLQDKNSCAMLLSQGKFTGWFGAKQKGSKAALSF